MKNAKIETPRIKERDIWSDMFRNPADHKSAFTYLQVSFWCLLAIVAIRILI